MTFQEFQATKKQIPDLSVLTKYDDDRNVHALTYLDSFYIGIDGKTYRLVLGRDEFESEDLEWLERELYKFALEEGACG